MFAIGVVRRMTNIMFVAWEFTFSTALCQPDDHRVHSNEIRRNASLVVTGNNILVSLAADPSSFVTCSSRDQSDMFWSIKDNGNSSELMYSMPLLVSTLSVYVDNQPKNRHHYSVGLGLVWTSPFSEPGEIIGINLRNGTIVYKIPLSKYFGQNVSITTNIMVGQNTNGTILVFGVQNGTSARQNWVMGMQVTNGAVSTATLLWNLQVPVTGAAWGQVISFHVGPDDGGGVRLAVLSTDSNRPTLITIKSK
ncbi:hypothetical protein SNE40_012826 [Patella caerulea]